MDFLPQEVENIDEKAIREMVSVWEEAVSATHTFLSDEDIEAIKPDVSAALSALKVFAIKEKGSIVAFMGTGDGKLEMLFVQPSCFGKGFGRRLVDYAKANEAVVYVDVNEDNKGAAEFYKKQGFVFYKRMPVDYQGRPFPLLCLKLQTACEDSRFA